ncbi:MAG: DNA polymerase III subunit delta' [Deltaproteobacteria bacterium]|nr:DNA polymerase III subunit delta' [Deltaproteobacteria bacterium]
MSFKNIHGHERQVRFLLMTLERKRMPHAYLFSGMTGVGKRSVALELAKVINCADKASPADACDRCPSCLKMTQGNHPDFVSIEPEGQFVRIESIRSMQNQMQFAPLEGPYRIVVVNDADKMHITSANALLKTLEEPPPRNLLVLITANPNGLPRTILSRCQRIHFPPLGREVIASHFVKQHGSTDADASMIAGTSGGNLARAIEMVQEDFKSLRDRTMEDLTAIHDKNMMKMLTFTNNFGKDRTDIVRKLDIIQSCYRDALVYRETGKERSLLNRDRMDIIEPLSRRFDGKRLLEHLRTVGQALQAIDRNANKALTLEAMMFKLVHQ